MLNWAELEHTCRSCQKCALAETRHNVVFGEGNREAEGPFDSGYIYFAVNNRRT